MPIFVAGWRSATGWICSISLGIIIAVSVASWAFDWKTADEVQELVLAITPLYLPVLLGMLGLRTAEKKMGIHRNNMK